MNISSDSTTSKVAAEVTHSLDHSGAREFSKGEVTEQKVSDSPVQLVEDGKSNNDPDHIDDLHAGDATKGEPLPITTEAVIHDPGTGIHSECNTTEGKQSDTPSVSSSTVQPRDLLNPTSYKRSTCSKASNALLTVKSETFLESNIVEDTGINDDSGSVSIQPDVTNDSNEKLNSNIANNENSQLNAVLAKVTKTPGLCGETHTSANELKPLSASDNEQDSLQTTVSSCTVRQNTGRISPADPVISSDGEANQNKVLNEKLEMAQTAINDNGQPRYVDPLVSADETDLVAIDAGAPFRAEICKVLETVCRQVFIGAQKFVRITGNLNFCIDDVEEVIMSDVNHLVDSIRVHRAKRGRPRKQTPISYTQQVINTKRTKPVSLNWSEEEIDTYNDEPVETPVVIKTEPSFDVQFQDELPTVKPTYQCSQCAYTTVHLGFYNKHIRVKHANVHNQETPEAGVTPQPKKRGRPRKAAVLQKYNPAKEGEDSSVESTLNDKPVESVADESQDVKELEKSKPKYANTGKFHCDQCEYKTDHSGHYRDHLNRHKGIKPHQCTSCTKSFIRLDDLRKHEALHLRKFECHLCDEVCADRPELKSHLKDVHGDAACIQSVACTVCKKSFISAGECEKHMDAKHNNICSICGETFTRIVLLKQHKAESHPQESLTCTICLKTCASRGALRKHLHRHRAGSSFPCDICKRSFTAQSTLYHHKRGVHSDLKPYKCTQCEKRFNFHHSLKLHVLQHKGVRPYTCEVCGKTYLTATHLKSHKQAVHSDGKKFACVICNKRFPYENSLKMHMMLHTGNRPFLCNRCGRGFVTHGALKTHEASHVDSKDWQCEICNKMYKTEALLRAHRRRHTDEGSRFMCDVCGHTFMYKSNLEAHYAVHSNERKYTCSECGCTFKTAATLYSHRLVHKTEVPFNCTVCNKAFKSKERKLAHEKRHMGDKPFQCDICKRSFPDKGGLSKHTKTVHSKVKRFVCPVCKKTCSRADNLRVHMRIHREPSLLKLDWKALMTNEDQPDELSSPDVESLAAGDQSDKFADNVREGESSKTPHSDREMGEEQGIVDGMLRASRDLQPCDLRQVVPQQQPGHVTPPSLQSSPYLQVLRHPVSVNTTSAHHSNILLVPDPTMQRNLHPLQAPPLERSIAGVPQHHHHASVSQTGTTSNSMPTPPRAHHQQGVQFDTMCPEDNHRMVQVVMPPAAHSGGGDDCSGLARDYTEHAMLFMQYPSHQN